MNDETTIEAARTAQVADSTESKSKRSGKRPGAGRKPNLAKRLLKGFSRDAILEAAGNIDVGAVITGLLKSKREKTRLETLVFVRDSVLGRPAQSLNVSGGLMHAHTAWRPLSTLSDAEIEQLDAISKKLLVAPGHNASQYGPHNQIESRTAIEALETETGANEAPE
jgi:hypothetical protein